MRSKQVHHSWVDNLRSPGLRNINLVTPMAPESIRKHEMQFLAGDETVTIDLMAIVERFPEYRCAEAGNEALIEGFENSLELVKDLEVRLAVLRIYQGIYDLKAPEPPMDKYVGAILEHENINPGYAEI